MIVIALRTEDGSTHFATLGPEIGRDASLADIQRAPLTSVFRLCSCEFEGHVEQIIVRSIVVRPDHMVCQVSLARLAMELERYDVMVQAYRREQDAT